MQRKTQSAEYWQKQFKVDTKDLETIYNQILELNQPVSLDELAISLVKHHCDEEELARRTDLQAGRLYQPKEAYSVDETIIFPALDFATGKVVASRQGHHPDYGTFTVIAVDMGNGGSPKEFAAGFPHDHLLNTSDYSLANLQGLASPEELYDTYKKSIVNVVSRALTQSNDFVRFQDKFFLKDALPEFHEGLFNIADAAIDINQGPLAIDNLIEQMGMLQKGETLSDVTRFSVNYQLANDERFVDVGPTGEVLWYLERIEPPEVTHPPRRLQTTYANYDVSDFDDDLLALLADIDDETTHPDDAAPANPNAKTVTIVLNYPHWRVGTLPITPKTQHFFPASNYNPVLFEFVDGRTGNTFPGWTVSDFNYVFGLDAWYKKNKLPVGAYITLKRTDNPMQVIVDYQATRTQRDWVRMARVTNKKLTFQMNPSALNCKYDELMMISDATPDETEKLWVSAEERETPLYRLICNLFPELSKLNPQSTVHAKTLYSAVNVVRRASPGPIFQELISHACFIPMNHGYWTYDPNLKD